MHELALEARALTKRFGKVTALDGLDLQIQRTESLALLGDAAAGKSTALRLFAGLARPSSGSLTVLDAAPGSRAGIAARRRLGVVRQEPSFADWMTGRELVRFAAELAGIGGSAADEQVELALGHVGLADAGDRRLTEYSLPMRQRLEIAQALLGDPALLLLDEPLGWLDPAGRSEILDLLRGLRGSVAMVVATSDIALAEWMADRVVVLDHGRALADEATAPLLDRAAPSDYVLEAAPGPGLALAGLSARLRQQPWVRDLQTTDGVVRVGVVDEERAERELLSAVVSTGLPVKSLRRERPAVAVLVGRLRGDES